MVVARAEVPARLRVDAGSLSARGDEIEAALGQALERAVVNVGAQLERAGAGGGEVRARAPEFAWTGPGLTEVPLETRRRFEQRVAKVVLAAAPTGSEVAPLVVAVPASGGAVTYPPPRPRPDEQLEAALAGIRALAERYPQPLTSRSAILADLERFIELFDLTDPARYTAIGREVELRFGPEVLLAFLTMVETMVEERRSWRSSELRGPTGTPGPGLLLPHLLHLPGGVTGVDKGVDTERLGYALDSVGGFIGGVLDGFREKVTNEELQRLAERAGWSSAFSAFFPPVFVLGAAHGIVQDVWEGLKGAVELVANLPEIIHAVDQMLDIMFSPAGRDVARTLGIEVGRLKAGEVHDLLAQNFVTFTYNLGRIVGPSIVYAILSFFTLGGVAAAAVAARVAALAARLAPILVRLAARFPRLAVLLARAGKLRKVALPDPKAPHTVPHPSKGAGLEQSVVRELAKKELEKPPVPEPSVRQPPVPEPAVVPEVLPEVSPPPEGLTRGVVKGGKRPKMEGHSVPWRPKDEPAPVILDLEDIKLRPGEKVRAAVERVRKVIGKPLGSFKPLKEAWEAAVKHVLNGRPLSSVTRQEMLGHPPYAKSLYDRVRDRFWQHEVPKRPDAQAVFADAGFDASEAKAPMLITDGRRAVSDLDRRVSLDHSAEKAQADNWRKAVDADNLVFEFQRPNTWREVTQARHLMRDDPFAGWVEWRIGDPWPEAPK